MYVFPFSIAILAVGVYIGYQFRHLEQKCGRNCDRNNHVGDQRRVLHSR